VCCARTLYSLARVRLGNASTRSIVVEIRGANQHQLSCLPGASTIAVCRNRRERRLARSQVPGPVEGSGELTGRSAGTPPWIRSPRPASCGSLRMRSHIGVVRVACVIGSFRSGEVETAPLCERGSSQRGPAAAQRLT
jgi:hypothetical protein